MIQMNEQQDMSPDKSVSVSGFNINPFDMLLYLLNRWYWYVLAVALLGGYAWLQYAQTPFMYSRSATVMIKNTQRTYDGLDRFKPTTRSNISNEILQFKSHKLMREVVKRLNANVCYLQDEGLRQNELYTQSPVSVRFLESEIYRTGEVDVTPINDKQVKLSIHEGDSFGKTMTAQLGDTIKTSIGKLLINKTLYYTDKWYNNTIHVQNRSVDNMASMLIGGLNISKVENDATIIHLSLQDYSTVRADDVLNTLITVYNEETIKDKNQIAINTSNFINERLIIIEKELGGVESQIEDFKRANTAFVGSMSGSYSGGDKDQLKYQANEIEMQLQMAQFIRDYLVDPSKNTGLIPSNTGLADMNIQAQIVQYNTSKLKRDKLAENSSDKNPVVQELNNTLHAIHQSIIRDIDNLIVSINAKLKQAHNRTQEAQQRIYSMPTQQRQMASIERQHRIKEELYLFLLNKREENALSQATTESDARVLDPAGGSDKPFSPRGKNILMGGVMKGIALPTVFLLALMFFDTKIRTRKDLEDHTSIPFLGEIPQSKRIKERTKVGERSIIVKDEHHDVASEAFRIIRTNMDFMCMKNKEMKVITFSSFGPGAGKTFVSTNLAASISQTKKKVILVDLDIRKGTLSSHYHRDKKGVTLYLSGHSGLDDIITPNGICEGLDLIPAGPIPPNPSELLLSERLDEMIAELRNRYDYIIVDNVPIGVVADASITNRIADVTVFVVRAGRIDRRMLPELEKLYRGKQLTNMSIILNGTKVRNNGYGYGYGYGYGNGYGPSKKDKVKAFWKRRKHN